MNTYSPILLAVIFFACDFAACVNAREWSSPNGHYKLEAELIAFDDKTVVLKPARGKLISAQLAELSESDRSYVKDQAEKPSSPEENHLWTTATGMKVPGKVLAYGKKQLTVQRQLGKVLINDQPFTKLDSVQQEIVLQTLSHLEGQTFDEARLTKWARKLGAEIKSYPLSGVLMELKNGEIVGVPFFLFSQSDLKALEPGWESWLAAAEDEESRQREDLYVRAQADQYQRSREQQQQVEMLKLEMLARATGALKVWEVQLVPVQVRGYPLRVLVPANDSATASGMAMRQYPGYRVNAVKRSRELINVPR
jgi:hypothetical protein